MQLQLQLRPRGNLAAAAGRRRWLTAAIVALALLVPGGATVGTTMALKSRDGGADVASMLDGTLPFQDDAPDLDIFMDAEQLSAVPVGPQPVAEPVRAVLSSSRVIEQLGQSGIPAVALRAYHGAADGEAVDDPACGIRWSLLAAIGRVESNHGRFGGAQLREDGYGTRPIRGIPLDGRPNVALIRDTDRGALDGDTTYDRAVGPMQFIPSTWRSVGVDGNGDGRRDPDNMFDATRGAAGYLCAGGGNLRDIAGQAQAVRRYNNADEYVRVVLSLARMYDTGRIVLLPSLPTLGPPAGGTASAPASRSGVGSADSGAGSGAAGGSGSGLASGSGSVSGSASGAAGGSGSGTATGSGPAPAPTPTTTTAPTPTTVPAPTPTTVPPGPGSGGTPAPAPAPTPTTTAPAPATTTTIPPRSTTTTTAPGPGTTPPGPTTTTTAPAPEPQAPDTAAVGWAPAMRQLVAELLEDQPAQAPAPHDPNVPAPGTPACPPPDTPAPQPRATAERQCPTPPSPTHAGRTPEAEPSG
jgi:membrane-bound lytic murein transglycosylase B